MYEPEFRDYDELLVVIDEIQDSSVVYSKIRELAREFLDAFQARYLESPLETAAFDKVFSSIATMMLKEKKRTKDLDLH